MHVETAQLPGADASDDRVFVTENAVIVLDGASAFRPVPVPAAVYADTLGKTMAESLSSSPSANLVSVLADGIEETASVLSLTPGDSPSSTVAMARVNPDQSTNLLVLGDSQIATPRGVLRDERLSDIAPAERGAYLARLAEGHGYDDTHHGLIRALQAEQARHRNMPRGYWIAEADPSAASQAMRRTLTTPWLILATDGAYRPLEHLKMDEWRFFRNFSGPALLAALEECQKFERTDPDGQALPRSKRHDDKTLAAISLP
jgi:hypothetical protein